MIVQLGLKATAPLNAFDDPSSLSSFLSLLMNSLFVCVIECWETQLWHLFRSQNQLPGTYYSYI